MHCEGGGRLGALRATFGDGSWYRVFVQQVVHIDVAVWHRGWECRRSVRGGLPAATHHCVDQPGGRMLGRDASRVLQWRDCPVIVRVEVCLRCGGGRPCGSLCPCCRLVGVRCVLNPFVTIVCLLHADASDAGPHHWCSWCR